MYRPFDTGYLPSGFAISIFLFTTFFAWPTSAQNVDSVLLTLEGESVVTKLKKLDDLAWDYMYVNYDFALAYALAANQIATDDQHFTGMGQTYNTLGVIKRKLGHFEDSKYYYRMADRMWDRTDNQFQKININLNLANVTRAQGYYDSALLFGNKGLAIAEELGDSAKVADLLLGIGQTYSRMGWKATAVEVYKQGAEIELILGDQQDLSLFWSNMGEILRELKDYEEAKNYFNLCLEIDQASGNQLNLSITYLSLGLVYRAEGQLDSARRMYAQAIELAENIGDELLTAEIKANQYEMLPDLINQQSVLLEVIETFTKYGHLQLVASAELSLGGILLDAGQPQEALVHLKQGLAVAENIGFAEVQTKAHRRIGEAYQQIGKGAEASRHFQQYITLSDSLNNTATQARIAELENQFELNSKEHQIALQEAEIARQGFENQRNTLIGIAILVVLLLIFSLTIGLLRRRNLRNRLQHEEEKARLKAAQIQAVIASQESERQRFAMDLHDDFGQLISALRLTIGDRLEKATDILDSMYTNMKEVAFDVGVHAVQDVHQHERSSL